MVPWQSTAIDFDRALRFRRTLLRAVICPGQNGNRRMHPFSQLNIASETACNRSGSSNAICFAVLVKASCLCVGALRTPDTPAMAWKPQLRGFAAVK